MILILVRLYRRWQERRGQTAREEAAPQPAGDVPSSPQAVAAVTRRHAHAPRRKSAGSRGLLALVVHETRYDLLASMRNPRARFFTFLFPIVLLVVFIGVFGHKGHTTIEGVSVPLSVFYVGGILAMSIIVASYASLVLTVTTARETGVFKRRRATPVPPAVLIAGNVIATLVIALVMATLLLVIGRLGYGISMPFAALVSTYITIAVGTIAFSCIGYAAAGMISSVDAAQPLAQATLMPLYFISGVWIPNTSLSQGLRDVASVFPVAHLADALHKATVATSFGSAFAASDLLMLAAWGLAAGMFAAMRFSWLPKAATA